MNLSLKLGLKDSKLAMHLIRRKLNNFHIMLYAAYHLLIFKNFFIYSFVRAYEKIDQFKMVM